MPKILLIDDSTFMRKVVRDTLEKAGFDVDDFLPLSSLEVVQRIKGNLPDLILTDLNMPEVDGMEVAKMAKRAGATIPVIILTATHDQEKEAQLRTMGVRRILHKPINGEALVKAVQEVLAIP